MGSVFWLTILYSLVGYSLFVLLSSLVALQLSRGEIEERKARTLAFVTFLALIVSGPLSWGMVIRNTLRLKEESS